MGKTNIHSAAGSFLGFLFQIERLLFWLSTTDSDGIIGIETDDDITVRLNEGESIRSIYEQAKNSNSNTIPFSDKSIDLWKTLSIWVENVQNKNIPIEKAQFSTVTNKRLPKTRIIQKISDAKSEKSARECIKELRNLGKNPSNRLKTYAKKVLECPDDILIKIIQRTTVMDGTCHHSAIEFKKKIKNNLSIGPKVRFNHVYEKLLGYLTDTVIAKWRLREDTWIEVNTFRTVYNNIVAEDLTKPFIERTISSLPSFPQETIKKTRSGIFAKQLESINCENDEIMDAVFDFLRAEIERSRHAREGEIREENYIAYLDDLSDKWKSVSRLKFRLEENKMSPEDLGYYVFHNTIVYKGHLCGQVPEQSYTHRGNYHFLANELKIGWRPDWKKKFKNTTQDNENN